MKISSINFNFEIVATTETIIKPETIEPKWRLHRRKMYIYKYVQRDRHFINSQHTHFNSVSDP